MDSLVLKCIRFILSTLNINCDAILRRNLARLVYMKDRRIVDSRRPEFLASSGVNARSLVLLVGVLQES